MGKARDRRKRDEKKRGAKSHREEVQLEVRRRVKALLKDLKLLGDFEAMPADSRQQFYDICGNDPVLIFDPSFPSCEAFGGAYLEVRCEAESGFKYASILVEGRVMRVREFMGIAVPLEGMARSSLAAFRSPMRQGPRPPASVMGFLEKAAEALGRIVTKAAEADLFTELHHNVVVPLVSRSRLDGNLLHAKLSYIEAFRGKRMAMTLYAEKPAMKRLGMGRDCKREPRSMYRVGTPNTWNGIEWASWTHAAVGAQWAEQLGMPLDAQWPVFVQEHALQRLRSRLDTYAYADWAEHWLYQSMRQPKIVRRGADGDLMVAYEVQEKRLGYLAVSVRSGMVTVRTFLFLTMRNTPEGRELARRLRLTPDEVDYLRLHELSRFTRTDLKDDPTLRQLFEECGCGHLFELAEESKWMVPRSRPVTQFASELKQYVGLAA